MVFESNKFFFIHVFNQMMYLMFIFLFEIINLLSTRANILKINIDFKQPNLPIILANRARKT